MDRKVLILLLLAHLTPVMGASREYYLVSEPLSWYDAQSYCRENHADLATIESVEDRDKVKALIRASSVTSSHKWIGLSTGNQWRWSMGDTYLYDGNDNLGSWFVFTEDNSGYQEHCAMIDQSILYDRNCEELYKSVCYDEPSMSYIPITTPMTWQSAQSHCREMYTDLTSMRTEQEKDSITSVIDTQSAWWVGLYKERFSWSDQSNSSFRSWAGGEPKGSSCVAIWGDQNWDDYSCSATFPFICSVRTLKFFKIVLKTEGSVDLNDPLIQGAVQNHINKLLEDQSVAVKLTWRKQTLERDIFIKQNTSNIIIPGY